ncbi:carcinine hydrolase/isopenicillin-N N-acyltransferase family protein [Rhizobium beringeri]
MPEPSLIRNYDYSPRLLQAPGSRRASTASASSRWSIACGGVLDGINEDGLAVSLAFGGRTAVGQGIRHARLCCDTCWSLPTPRPQPLPVLRDIPVHMSYSIAVIVRRETTRPSI